MRNPKKKAVFFSACIFAGLLANAVPVAAAQSDVYYPASPGDVGGIQQSSTYAGSASPRPAEPYEYYYSQLSDNAKLVYDTLANPEIWFDGKGPATITFQYQGIMVKAISIRSGRSSLALIPIF